MSDTPRTDARERIVLSGVGGDFKVVLSDFARQLERELAAAKAHIARLEAAGDSLKEEARPTMFDSDETRKRCMDAINAWDVAREAKP